MPRTITTFVAVLALCVGMAALQPVAQAQVQTRGPSTPEVSYEGGPVYPGTFDLTFGLGGFLYTYIEPGVDIGVLPLGDKIVLSVGGYLNAGYCFIGCGILNFFIHPARVSAWHVNPMGRVLFHLNAIAELASLPGIDAYGGVVAGPNYYRASLTIEDGVHAVTGQGFTFLVGPTLGGRYTLQGQSGFFIYGEARYLIEFGSQQWEVTDDRGVVYNQNSLIHRGGRKMALGIGVRF
jgi:hypothetical protein